MMQKFLETAVGYAWGLPLVILLIGGGLVLLLNSKFLPLRYFFHAFALLTGRYHHKNDKNAEGQISHFAALSNALSATIGLGNIAGVAIALHQGGPGAIFWMWVSALIGMNTKFFECSLAVMYRGKDYRGDVQGGPMYVIETALPRYFKGFALFFAVCGLIGTLSIFNVNQLTVYLQSQYSISKFSFGILLSIVVAYILYGGLARLSNWTKALVPLMCILYVFGSLWILLEYADKIIPVFSLILRSAFSGQAALGGMMGVGVMEALKIGVKRAAFSNEAGMGTAPMAHGNVKTSEPVSEGMVAMLGPFLDTIVVCSMTALVLLAVLEPQDFQMYSGVLLTKVAFERAFPGYGANFLAIIVFLFSFSTILGMANYNKKCWDYIFKGRRFFRNNTFIFVYTCTVFLGALAQVNDIVNLIDIALACMAVPNLLSTLLLRNRVKEALLKYHI